MSSINNNQSAHLTQLYKKYDDIYNEMKERNYAQISIKGFRPDPLLLSKDDRRCVAWYSNLEFSPTEDFFKLLRELSAFKHKAIIYTPDSELAVLHTTWLQIVSFDNIIKNGKISSEDEMKIINEVNWCTYELSKFQINFKGISAITTGLLMCGYPSIDIDKTRIEARGGLNDLKRYSEPYHNNLVHSTLMRIHTGLSEKETIQLLELADKYKNKVLATAKVNKMSIGYASWLMHDVENFYDKSL